MSFSPICGFLKSKFNHFCCHPLSNSSNGNYKTTLKSTINHLLTTSEGKSLCIKRLQQAQSSRPAFKLKTPTNRESDGKAYAVLIPLMFDVDGPSLLFTLRSGHMNSHRGEVSFPGGLIEMGETTVDAAIRETAEELGIEPNLVQVWGEIGASLTKDLRSYVTPVVGQLDSSVIHSIADLRPRAEEVQEVFTVPLLTLADVSNFRQTQFRPPSRTHPTWGRLRQQYCTPVYVGTDTHRIWGLTAVIVHQLLSAMLPRELYRSKLSTVVLQT